MVNGLHHIAFRVWDFDASVRFYTERLGMKPKLFWGEGNSRAVFLDTGGPGCIEIFAGGTKERKPEGEIIHFALKTRNCDAVLERVRALGTEITMEPTTMELGRVKPSIVRIAFCKGLDGEEIELLQSDDV